jgi:hypothetical protein
MKSCHVTRVLCATALALLAATAGAAPLSADDAGWRAYARGDYVGGRVEDEHSAEWGERVG